MGKGRLFSSLMFSCLDTKVTETNKALEELALIVRSDEELKRLFIEKDPREILEAVKTTHRYKEFLARLEEFLERYGHREAGGSMLLARGSWSDTPEVVIGIIKGLLNAGGGDGRSCSGFKEALDEVFAHPIMRLGVVRSLFQSLLRNGREFHRIREDTRFYAMMIAPVLRRVFAEMGRRPAAQGLIDSQDDVYYLKLGELEEIRDWPPEGGGGEGRSYSPKA